MKALGVGFFTRSIGTTMHPTVELKKHGDKYTWVTTSTFKTSEITFTPGKEFEEETLDGRKVKSIITFDGNKMIHKQGGQPKSTIIREFKDKEMIATLTVNDIVSTRKYVVES